MLIPFKQPSDLWYGFNPVAPSPSVVTGERSKKYSLKKTDEILASVRTWKIRD